MAKTSVLSIYSNVWGDGLAGTAAPAVFTNAAAPGKQETFAFVNGANTLTVPAGSKSLLIENSTQILNLNGPAGTVGINLPAGQPCVIPVAFGTNVLATSTGASTADLTWL